MDDRIYNRDDVGDVQLPGYQGIEPTTGSQGDTTTPAGNGFVYLLLAQDTGERR